MAHLNITFKSFSLLFHLEHRSVQEFLAAPPLCYVLLVNDFFQLAWLGIPKILMENKKNLQKAQVKKKKAVQVNDAKPLPISQRASLTAMRTLDN